MKALSVSRAADRAFMVQQLQALCLEIGAACEVEEVGPREVWVAVAIGSAQVAIGLDGSDPQDKRGEFCMAWVASYYEAVRMTDAFGTAAGGAVNCYHRRKCTAFAAGFPDLLNKLRRVAACVAAGEAFIPEQ